MLLLFVYTLVLRTNIVIVANQHGTPRLYLAATGMPSLVRFFNSSLLRWYLRLVLGSGCCGRFQDSSCMSARRPADRLSGRECLRIRDPYFLPREQYWPADIHEGKTCCRSRRKQRDSCVFSLCHHFRSSAHVYAAVAVPTGRPTPNTGRLRIDSLFAFEHKWIEGAPKPVNYLGEHNFQSLRRLGE